MEENMPLPKSRKKLLNLFSQIKDESVKRIIAEVISIENEYRFSSSANFPRRKIEDAIDIEANYIEANPVEPKKKEGGKGK
jgi:hypothetical protein